MVEEPIRIRKCIDGCFRNWSIEMYFFFVINTLARCRESKILDKSSPVNIFL
jgi:hypothetical protein